MVQVRVTGSAKSLNQIKAQLSEIIHQCLQDAIGTPKEKRFQRFYPLDADNFYYPDSRSSRYTIIEIIMFEGRSVTAKKKLTGLLFERIQQQLGIAVEDIEIVMFDLPKHNWGIRGIPGDELVLGYKASV
ncbi:MAG: tautomerase family protein [Cyanobacteria bacterium P01_D01_bin.1]